MVHKITKKSTYLLIVLMLIGLSSCFKDKAELLTIDTSCDTANVTFALSVAPIIQNNCQGCHSGGTPSGSISLSNYTEIKTAADNGNLMGTIRHLSGYSAMPKGGNMLRDCDIRKLEIWISKGTPNN